MGDGVGDEGHFAEDDEDGDERASGGEGEADDDRVAEKEEVAEKVLHGIAIVSDKGTGGQGDGEGVTF